jgi:hypothetical protein
MRRGDLGSRFWSGGGPADRKDDRPLPHTRVAARSSESYRAGINVSPKHGIIRIELAEKVVPTTDSAIGSETDLDDAVAETLYLHKRSVVFIKLMRTWNHGRVSSFSRDLQRVCPARECARTRLCYVDASHSEVGRLRPGADQRAGPDRVTRSRTAKRDDSIKTVPMEAAMPAPVCL